MPKVSDIINETKALIAEKRAQFEAGQQKQALAGKDPASYPGAEHDKPSDADQSPSPEVGDKKWLPNGLNRDQKGGDDSPITRGHATDTTQSPEQPPAKPLITADANAKTAEQAETLLSKIRTYQKSAAAARAEATAAKADEKTAAKKCECGKADCKECMPPKQAAAPAEKPADKPVEKAAAPVKTEEKPAEKTAAPVEKAADKKDEKLADKAEKAAGGFNMELTQEVLAKIASMALATEEGMQFVEAQLTKAAGAEAAAELLGFIQTQDAELQKLAAFDAGAQDAEMLIAKLAESQQADRNQRINKIAGAIRTAISKKAEGENKAGVPAEAEVGATKKVDAKSDVPETPEAMVTDKSAMDIFFKLGQEVADASIAAGLGGQLGGMDPAAPLQDAGAAGGDMGAGAGGVAPDAAGGMGGMGGGDEEAQVAAALEQLVQEGVIGPEELQQILQILEAGGAGGDAGAPPADAGAAAGAPPAAAGAGAPPADAGAGGPPPAAKSEGGGGGSEGGSEETPKKETEDKPKEESKSESKDDSASEDKIASYVNLIAGALKKQGAAAPKGK